jgi:hypothetical protein
MADLKPYCEESQSAYDVADEFFAPSPDAPRLCTCASPAGVEIALEEVPPAKPDPAFDELNEIPLEPTSPRGQVPPEPASMDNARATGFSAWIRRCRSSTSRELGHLASKPGSQPRSRVVPQSEEIDDNFMHHLTGCAGHLGRGLSNVAQVTLAKQQMRPDLRSG